MRFLQHISESVYRKPLLNNVELSEMCKETTPQDRSYGKVEQECTRSTAEIFSSSTPDVLDLQAYLNEKH